MTETMKVKPWGEGQGDFVVINASDFDADIHELFGVEPEVKDEFSDLTNNKLKDYLTAAGVAFDANANKAALLAACRAAKAE